MLKAEATSQKSGFRTLGAPGGRPAFTLTELMIAIALVLILILGINQVFRITTETVGHGQALSTITRDKRAAQAVLYEDLRTAVSFEEAPGFIIRSQWTETFLNRAEEETGADKSVYRTDRLSFFGRDRFPRQTGNDGVYVAPMDSTEAWIWFGHLRRPPMGGGTGGNFNPGENNAQVNPDNFYAEDWILGRAVILLREKDEADGQIRDANGVEQVFIDRARGYEPTSPDNQSLAPLSWRPGPLNPLTNVYLGRLDLAATSISLYRQAVQNYAGADPWWQILSMQRFQGNPYPTKPHSSEGVARTVPVFLQHCSQFIVEFTGDFLTQNDNGVVVDDQPDGTIDFYIDPVTGVREIQWYGLFRDVNGDGDPDVIPVWFAAGASDPTAGPYEFERPPVAGHYIAAWGPDVAGEPTPSLIRITVTLEDPTGRLAEGQTFEYVMRLP